MSVSEWTKCDDCGKPLKDCACEPDTSDIPEASDDFFKNATVIYPHRAQGITIIDEAGSVDPKEYAKPPRDITDKEYNEKLKKQLDLVKGLIEDMTEQLRYITDVHDEEIFGKARWAKLRKAAKLGAIAKVKIDVIKKHL